MAIDHTRGLGVGLVAAAAATVAVLSGAAAAHAETSDAGGVPVGHPLDVADANLTDGVTALVQQLFEQPTLRDLAQPVSMQDGALDALGQLQSAQDAISAQTGSLSGLVEELLFAPVNHQWLTASDAVLSADLAFAAAIADDTGVSAAQLDLLGAEFQLLGAQFSSLPIIIAGTFFGADLTP